jgi:mannosyltransferase
MGENKFFSEKSYCFLIIAAVLIAAFFRLYAIDRLSLWADELWGVMASSRGSWMAMMQDLISNDNHPPGYQTILYFVMLWFGDTETIIRMPSAIAGIVTVFLVYRMGRQLISVETGIVAAFIVAGSYQLIFYSQEARAYSMLTLFCTCSAYSFFNLFVLEKINNKNILLFTLSGIICVYLHYAGLLFVGCELILCLGLMALRRNKKMLIAAAYGFGLIAILYIKWFPVMIAQMHNGEFYWEKTPNIYSVFGTFKYLFGPDSARTFIYGISFLAGLYYSCRTLASSPQRKNKVILATIFLVIFPPLAVFIQSWIFSSVYTNRYFIFLIPLVAIVCAYGFISAIELIASKKTKQLAFTLALLFVCFSSLFFNRNLYTSTFGKQDFRGAAAFIAEDLALITDQGLVFVSHEFFDYYLKKQPAGYQSQGYLLFPGQFPKIVQKIRQSGAKNFYYLEVATSDQTPMSSRLEMRYKRESYRRFNGINVTKYNVYTAN